MKKSFFLIPILLLLLLVILPGLGFLLAGGGSGGGFSLAEPAYAADSGTVMITDSDGDQLVVTQDTPEEQLSGNGWIVSFGEEENTLTLDGFQGQEVVLNNVNLHLVGENTITVPDVSGVSGLSFKGNDHAKITAAAGGSLTITSAAGRTNDFTGIDTVEWIYLNSGTVNIEAIDLQNDNFYGVGVNGSFYVGYDAEDPVPAHLNIHLTGSGDDGALYGSAPNYGFLSVYGQEGASVQIDVTTDGDSQTYGVRGSLTLYDTKGTVNIAAVNQGTSTQPAIAVDQLRALKLAAGGSADFTGQVRLPYASSNSVKFSAELDPHSVSTDPAGNNYKTIIGNSGYYSGYFVCTDADDVPLTHMHFEYSEALPELVWTGTAADTTIPEHKVGDYLGSNYYFNYFVRGASSYAYSVNGMSMEVVEGSLPEGLGLNRISLGGTYSAPCEAGSCLVRVTDVSGTPNDPSDDRTCTFTLYYGAVTEQDYYLTVDGTQVNMAQDASGAGWSYTAADTRLTLNGYQGGPISGEKNYDLHLIGANTITVPDVSGAKGLSFQGNDHAKITAAAGGSLTITSAAGRSNDFTGIDNFEWIYLNSGTVNIEAIDLQNDNFYGVGVSGSLYVGYDAEDPVPAHLNIHLTGSGDDGALYGFSSNYGFLSVYGQEGASVQIDVAADGNAQAYGTYGALTLYGTKGTVNVAAVNQGTSTQPAIAVSQLRALKLAAGGSADFTGQVRLPYASSNSVKFSAELDPHSVSTDPAGNNYKTALSSPGYYSGYFVCTDADDVPLTHMHFEYSEALPELVWTGTVADTTIPEHTVGDYLGSNYYFNYFVRGASSYAYSVNGMNMEVVEGSLPKGLGLNRISLGGTYEEPCEAGSCLVRVTDVSGTPDDPSDDRTCTFTLYYGAVHSAVPVTGLTLDPDVTELILNQREPISVTVGTLPEGATYPYVRANYDANLLSVSAGNPDESGSTSFLITADTKAGTSPVRFVSTETGVSKSLTVYVKERKPAATLTPRALVNLTPNAAYTVDGTVYTADANGQIPIELAWRNKQIALVRTNEEPKCNSDPQTMMISRININGYRNDFAYTDGGYYAYTGSAIRPEFTLADLVPEQDYHVDYINNVNPTDSARISVTGKGHYAGNFVKYFTIHRADLADAEITGLADAVYTGSPITYPDLQVSLNGRTLTAGTDYTVEWGENTYPGTDAGSLTVTGIGNYYRGSQTVNFNILPAPVSSVAVENAWTDLRWTDNIPFTANLNEEGSAPDGIGLVAESWTDVTDGTVFSSLDQDPAKPKAGHTYEYGLTLRAPDYYVFPETFSFSFNGEEVTSYTLTTEEDGTIARLRWGFTAGIDRTPITEPALEDLPSVTYDGTAHTPDPVLTGTVNGSPYRLVNGNDYSVTYQDNTNAGTARLTIAGTGNYTGLRYAGFTIKPAPIKAASVTLADQTYTGSALTPAPVVKLTLAGKQVTLKSGTDYTVKYANNTAVGTATVTVTGKGNFTGTTSGTFKITQLSLAKAAVTGLSSKTYTGKAQTPAPTVKLTVGGKTLTLKSGTDYTVKYANNINVGTAKVTITGKGTYSGSVTKTFTIIPAKVTVPTVKTGLTYNGAAQAGTNATKAGGLGTTYKLAGGAATATKAGTYTVKYALADTKNYTWSDGTTTAKSLKWTIAKANLKNATIAAIKDQSFTGAALKPAPVVKLTLNKKAVTLKAGTDYTVSYKDNTDPGTATITITGKGNFTGTATKTFKIVKKAGEIERLAGADRYATSLAIAEAYRKELGVKKFSTLIVADGINFPDALAGAYLASVKNCPVISIAGPYPNHAGTQNALAYIKLNLQAGGNVYILGGPGSVDVTIEQNLKAAGFKVTRLAGSNRYLSNLAILKEAKVKAGSEFIVCTGADFADALSASATGKPVLLVAGNVLTADQAAYLSSVRASRFYMIGDASVISDQMASALQQFAPVTRVGSGDSYNRSLAIARKFFPGNQPHLNLASGENAADGLCGGPLAVKKGGPLLLTDKTATVYNRIVAYAKAANAYQLTVYGGEGSVTEAAAKAVIGIN